MVSRPLLSDYTDIADQEHPVMAYSLVEMWAEKTRSLLQRAEPRDLYDLAMLAAHDKGLPARAHGVYVRKAELKKLDPNALAERLDRRKPVLAKLAGEEGFEPSIPCSRDRCLTVRPLASEVPELPDSRGRAQVCPEPGPARHIGRLVGPPMAAIPNIVPLPRRPVV